MPKIQDHIQNEYESLDKMCETYGVTRQAYYRRIKRGWSVQEALTTPLPQKREKWSEEEIRILKEKFPTSGLNIPELNRSANSMQHMVSRLGIKQKEEWSDEETRMLIEQYPVHGTNIPKLNRTKASIMTHANKLGLKAPSKHWSSEEDAILKAKYQQYGTDIPELKKGRGSTSIINRAKRLGLVCLKNKWTEEEIRLIKDNYEKLGTKIPGLNKNPDSIMAMASKLGLEKISAARETIGVWQNNNCGLKVRLKEINHTNVNGKYKTKYIYEFEDGSIKKSNYGESERIAHPHLSARTEGNYCGFTTRFVAIDKSDDNWTAYYKCKCKKCGYRAIMTPKAMKEHYENCKQEAYRTHKRS